MSETLVDMGMVAVIEQREAEEGDLDDIPWEQVKAELGL